MAVRTFVHEIRGLAGLHRIALMGSLTTDKLTPKDADVLVTIDSGLDLTDLARAARRLQGAAQTRNLGADILLADPQHHYLGRQSLYKRIQDGRLRVEGHHIITALAATEPRQVESDDLEPSISGQI